MTRKCVLCKESNYKNVYSFFSAPKDPETRKSWENALSMEVTDDTYICSKHFHQKDIITHWVSGVPPHVITIKYKKCRLRPGAVPIVGVEFENNQYNSGDTEEMYELRMNRNDASFNASKKKSNPKNISNSINDFYFQTKKRSDKKSKRELETYEVRTNTEFIEVSELDVKQENQCFLIPREDGNVNFCKDSVNDSVCYNDNNVREYILKTEQKRHFVAQSPNKKQKLNFSDSEVALVDTIAETVEIMSEEDKLLYLSGETHEGQSMEIWDISIDKDPKNIEKECSTTMHLEQQNQVESMLFEDLLEAYTEVTLPKGWSALVIPKGHDTMVVYSFISTSNSRIPFVEKQVYLKSDMMLHCGTSTVEIDLFVHNLVREGRDIRVQTLADLEDVIEEFDQRRVCEAFNASNSTKKENDPEVAIREGSKWRHLECPILMNNDLPTCSKCASLARQSPRSKRRRDFLENVAADNSENETVKNPRQLGLNSVIEAIDALNIPEIQKIMMKQCIKANAELDAQKSIKFSRTWIFLCILLYLESSRMYRYLLLNNYLCLPSLFTIKRYLHRMKVEPGFYALFRRSVEPFQAMEKTVGRIKKKEPT